MPIRYSRELPLTEKEQWVGAMALNSTLRVMTARRLLASMCSPLFKLHLACNDRGEIIAFVLTGANVSDKDPNVFKVLAKRLYGKLFADKGYISQKLFDFLFEDGIQLVTGLRVNMKNKLMPFYDRMMLRKRYIIETINDMLKNTAQIVHSRHRSVNNFVMNLISALGAYCFFDNKPMALQGYCIEDTKQLSLF